MCKRYGILPSEFVTRDPYWIDFDTAVALRGQLEQAKAEEEALEESKQKGVNSKDAKQALEKSRQRHEASQKARGSLKERVKKMNSIEDIIKDRHASGVKGGSIRTG